MPDYDALFAQLSEGEQEAFLYEWKGKKWKRPERPAAAEQRGWMRYLTKPRRYPKWEGSEAEKNPLYLALKAKNRRAFRELLSRRAELTREETIHCAAACIGWGSDLLKLVLEKGDPAPICYATKSVTWQDTGYSLHITGSLPLLAAAFDDVASLECLLRHGYSLDTDYIQNGRQIFRDYHCYYSSSHFGVGFPAGKIVWFLPIDKKEKRSQITWEFDEADPLAAALFCGAPRCAAYLMEAAEATITKAARRAIAYPYFCLERFELNGIAQAHRAVEKALGKPLETVLCPEDFPKGNEPRFIPVVRRCSSFSPEAAKKLLYNILDTGDLNKSLREEELLNGLDLTELGKAATKRYFEDRYDQNRILAVARENGLPLDRCGVSPQTGWENLQKLLKEFPDTTPPPKGGLSGLAEALLRQLEGLENRPDRVTDQFLNNQKLISVLESEDSSALCAFLEENDAIPDQIKGILIGALGLQKEVDYAL